MDFRFIHAADIHLDSQLRGISSYEGAPVELLRSATRRALSELVQRALAEEVDFVVIAGDLYDGDWKDYNTGLFFAQQMGRLRNAKIPVVLVYGNHDAESAITKPLAPPDNVHAFGSRKAETFKLEALKVALHGQSYKTRDTTTNLAAEYPAPVPGWFNIGVLHTALEGHAEHAPYAPCSVAELRAHEYDYWALGHVHEYRIESQSPYVVFPGNLQGRHIRETGPRGAVLVTVESGEVRVERLIVDVLRWHRLEVDVSEASSMKDALRLIGGAFEAALEALDDDRPLVVRVRLHGRTAAHGELFGLEQQLREEVLALAVAFGGERVCVEKVLVRTEAELDAETLERRSDAIADLQLMFERATKDEAFLKSLADDLSGLLAKAPRSLLDESPGLAAVHAGDLAQLIEAVSPALIARLIEEG